MVNQQREIVSARKTVSFWFSLRASLREIFFVWYERDWQIPPGNSTQRWRFRTTNQELFFTPRRKGRRFQVLQQSMGLRARDCTLSTDLEQARGPRDVPSPQRSRDFENNRIPSLPRVTSRFDIQPQRGCVRRNDTTTLW